MLFIFRSVTLVGEKERKILKDIVKKARNPVKSRIVPQGELPVLPDTDYVGSA